MDINEAKQVLDDYKKGIATLDQIKMVENWYMAISREQELNSDEAIFSNVEDNIWEAILKRTGLDIEQPNHHISKLWPRVFAAASIVICIGIGFYFYQKNSPIPTEITAKNDIAPGGNKAFLTLADGKRIVLTDAKIGELAEQSGVKITKATDGQLIYTVSNLPNENNKINAYNTIETPRGGTYQVRLPDGTKVWLNAASTLRFPSSFARLVNRRVELLSGEAYFEVTKDKKRPFIVQTDQQEVKVLGTHFNINNYTDEPSVKTTLLEGRIKVITLNGSSKTLIPGQQSQITETDISVIDNIDPENVTAWKNGLFKFENADVKTVFRQIARWYDVEVNYQGHIKQYNFTGEIYRNLSLSETLRLLKFTGLKFKIEGQKITITNQE